MPTPAKYKEEPAIHCRLTHHYPHHYTIIQKHLDLIRKHNAYRCCNRLTLKFDSRQLATLLIMNPTNLGQFL